MQGSWVWVKETLFEARVPLAVPSTSRRASPCTDNNHHCFLKPSDAWRVWRHLLSRHNPQEVPLQALLALASGGMEASALARTNWAAVPATLPVLSLAFVYQNIVPVISSDLEVRDPALLCTACSA